MAIKNSLPAKDISAVLQAQKMLWEYLCSENLPGGAALKESVLAREFNLDYKMQELIREVSVTSYIRGTDVMLDTLKKEGKIRK